MLYGKVMHKIAALSQCSFGRLALSSQLQRPQYLAIVYDNCISCIRCTTGTLRHQSTNSTSASRSASASVSSTVSSSISNSNNNPQQQFLEFLPKFHPIYVHHVSRVALEHLQDNQSNWLIRRGLDRNLKIRNNGTFSLTFPDDGQIWTSYDPSKRQHWLSVCRNKVAIRFLLKDHDRAAMALQEFQKQQQKQQPIHRSTSLGVQEYHSTSVQTIQNAVDEMIQAVEEMKAKETQQLRQQHQEQEV